MMQLWNVLSWNKADLSSEVPEHCRRKDLSKQVQQITHFKKPTYQHSMALTPTHTWIPFPPLWSWNVPPFRYGSLSLLEVEGFVFKTLATTILLPTMQSAVPAAPMIEYGPLASRFKTFDTSIFSKRIYFLTLANQTVCSGEQHLLFRNFRSLVAKLLTPKAN